MGEDILFRMDEIINKHGMSICYFSKSVGNTELEKYKNSLIYNKDNKEFNIYNCTCIVYNDGIKNYVQVFNKLGEFIDDSYPDYPLLNVSKEILEEYIDKLYDKM